MALRKVEAARYEERESEHVSWLKRKLYAKTPLNTFFQCGERFRLRYDVKADEHWGRDLIEGIGGHAGLELVHRNDLEGRKTYRDEIRERIRETLLRLSPRIDSARPMDPDESLGRLVPLVELYRDNWSGWFSDVLAVERTFGVDEEIVMGGARIAGHLDLETASLVPDFKFVGKTSSYRKPLLFDVGMEIYRKATGKRTAILPLVKEAFTRIPDEKVHCPVTGGFAIIEDPQPVHHTPASAKAAEELVAYAVAQIEKGNLGAPPAEIGTGLCQRKYCDFWGRCRWTRHLPRSGLEPT